MSLVTLPLRAEHRLINRLCFTTFDFLDGAPPACSLCTLNPPIFLYAFSDDENAQAEYMKGFCCGPCAVKLLGVLEHVESKAWAGTCQPRPC